MLTPDFVKLSHNGASDAQASVYIWVGVAIGIYVRAQVCKPTPTTVGIYYNLAPKDAHLTIHTTSYARNLILLQKDCGNICSGFSNIVQWGTRQDWSTHATGGAGMIKANCHSTKGQWLVNQVKGRSHQAQLTR